MIKDNDKSKNDSERKKKLQRKQTEEEMIMPFRFSDVAAADGSGKEKEFSKDGYSDEDSSSLCYSSSPSDCSSLYSSSGAEEEQEGEDGDGGAINSGVAERFRMENDIEVDEDIEEGIGEDEEELVQLEEEIDEDEFKFRQRRIRERFSCAMAHIINKYDQPFACSDVVDLDSMEIVEDYGCLKYTPRREFGDYERRYMCTPDTVDEEFSKYCTEGNVGSDSVRKLKLQLNSSAENWKREKSDKNSGKKKKNKKKKREEKQLMSVSRGLAGKERARETMKKRRWSTGRENIHLMERLNEEEDEDGEEEESIALEDLSDDYLSGGASGVALSSEWGAKIGREAASAGPSRVLDEKSRIEHALRVREREEEALKRRLAEIVQQEKEDAEKVLKGGKEVKEKGTKEGKGVELKRKREEEESKKKKQGNEREKTEKKRAELKNTKEAGAKAENDNKNAGGGRDIEDDKNAKAQKSLSKEKKSSQQLVTSNAVPTSNHKTENHVHVEVANYSEVLLQVSRILDNDHKLKKKRKDKAISGIDGQGIKNCSPKTGAKSDKSREKLSSERVGKERNPVAKSPAIQKGGDHPPLRSFRLRNFGTVAFAKDDIQGSQGLGRALPDSKAGSKPPVEVDHGQQIDHSRGSRTAKSTSGCVTRETDNHMPVSKTDIRRRRSGSSSLRLPEGRMYSADFSEGESTLAPADERRVRKKRERDQDEENPILTNKKNRKEPEEVQCFRTGNSKDIFEVKSKSESVENGNVYRKESSSSLLAGHGLLSDLSDSGCNLGALNYRRLSKKSEGGQRNQNCTLIHEKVSKKKCAVSRVQVCHWKGNSTEKSTNTPENSKKGDDIRSAAKETSGTKCANENGPKKSVILKEDQSSQKETPGYSSAKKERHQHIEAMKKMCDVLDWSENDSDNCAKEFAMQKKNMMDRGEKKAKKEIPTHSTGKTKTTPEPKQKPNNSWKILKEEASWTARVVKEDTNEENHPPSSQKYHTSNNKKLNSFKGSKDHQKAADVEKRPNDKEKSITADEHNAGKCCGKMFCFTCGGSSANIGI
eukprot:Nk52_evm21s160 gene=Nk52_evmTU21s160